MKLISVFVATALATPVVSSFAQEDPLTRAEVRAQLYQIETAGYRPGSESPNYPEYMQAAEAKVAAQKGQTGVGGVSDGSSEAAGDRGASNSVANGIPAHK